MTYLIEFFLLHNVLLTIIEKYNYQNLLLTLAEKTESRLVYEFSQCELCSSHLIGLLFLPLFIIWFGFEWIYLIYPLISASLRILIKK